jgi:hypothetical protein
MPVRVSVGKAVKKTFPASLGETIAEQDSKLVHDGLPVECGAYGFCQDIA